MLPLTKAFADIPILDPHWILDVPLTYIIFWHILITIPRRPEPNLLGTDTISFSSLYSLKALHIVEVPYMFVELKHNKGLYNLY